jgi:hypothetical protein
MELKRLTHDADSLIRKVVSRYNQIYVPAGNISQVELDLMLDDLRKLYDTFKNIGQISLTLQNSIITPEVKVDIAIPSDYQPVSATTPVFSEKQVHTADIAAELPQPDPNSEPIYEIKPEIIPDPEPEVVLVNENEVETVPATENETEPVIEKQVLATTEISDLGKPIQENAENNKPVNPDPTPSMLADRFNTVNKSLSETLASSQSQAVMGSRILFQPIADLITGIGLNDKFSFISDLFGNSTAHYDEAIARIDKAVNLDEANWILQKYHTAEWSHKQESLSRLKDFIKRRFI